MQSTTAVDISQLIDERPVSRYQLFVAAMCALIVFVDGFDAQAMGYVAPALSAALDIPRGVLGSVISSGLVGMMIGALVSGIAADRIGRRPVLIGCAVIFGVGSLLTATAQSVEALVAFRAFTGLGMGGAMPNAIALTSEYMPRRTRGIAVSTMICGFPCGAAVGGFVAASSIPTFGWQSVFVVGGVAPLVVAALAFLWLPDSIRFLVARSADDERARRQLARIAPEVLSAHSVIAGKAERASGSVVTQLFTARRGVGTVLIWVVYFMSLLDLYFLNSWLPTIISDADIPVTTAIRLTALFQVGGIAGAVLLGAILDRFFSFWVLAACYLWAAASILLIGASSTSTLMLALTIASAGLGIIGGQNSAHAVTADFYPTTIRSTGVGWALGVGRVGSIVGPFIGGLLLAQGLPVRQVFWAAAIPALIAATAAAGAALAHGSRASKFKV